MLWVLNSLCLPTRRETVLAHKLGGWLRLRQHSPHARRAREVDTVRHPASRKEKEKTKTQKKDPPKTKASNTVELSCQVIQ